jgi:hypothetical protein
MSGVPELPVTFLIFNRPESTAEVFKAIRKARPQRLLVVADGPRAGVPNDAEGCRLARAQIKVDWPCRLERNYAEENLGCRERVSSGLDWAFHRLPETAILEDDCVPDPQFFRYCATLLKRYRKDPKVRVVCGSGFDEPWTGSSYRFSHYPLVWGWASWRRAWEHYDVHLEAWPEFRDADGLRRIFPEDALARRYWKDTFELMYYRKVDTWDYQLTFSLWKNGGLAVIPNGNLVTNVGDGPLATHTKAKGNRALYRPYRGLPWPLLAPKTLALDMAADRELEARNFSRRRWFSLRLRSWKRLWMTKGPFA